MRGKKAEFNLWWVIIGALLALTIFVVLVFIIIPGLNQGGGTIVGTTNCEVGVMKGECFAERQEGKVCLTNKQCDETTPFCCYSG